MAANFNGTSDAYNMGTPAALSLANNATMAMVCWVNFTDITTAQRSLVCKGFDGTNTAYQFQLAIGPATLNLGSFNGATHGPNVALSGIAAGWAINQWHHIYLEYTGSVWNFYGDGVFQATATDAIGPISTAERFAVGAIDSSGTFAQFFSGCLADVALFTGPLTGTEITNLGNGSLRPNTGMSKTLLGYWKLDTGGASQTDFSVNGNNGAAVTTSPGTCSTSPPFTGGVVMMPASLRMT